MNVAITLLGGFEVHMDGRSVPRQAWTRRHAAGLVKVLALAPGRQLHREQLIDRLWPDTRPDVAGPRLHKAAHYARRALGGAGSAVLLRNDLVALLPGAEVDVDVDRFRRLGEDALASGSAEEAARALRLYRGHLLPEDLYEEWTREDREVLRGLQLDLMRLAERWEDLLREDPLDEQAHLALIRQHADSGAVRSALRQLERMEQALTRELGTAPSAETERIRQSLLDASGRGAPDPAPSPVRLVGRRPAADCLRERFAQAANGQGNTLLVTGAAGVGKTAMLDLAAALARKDRWRTGRGTASAVEGSWPYAPVLEALADLCRHHPTLLDGLDDDYRHELDRGLSGEAATAWSGESAPQRLFVASAELLRLAAAGSGLLLVVDDLPEADEGSLRLLHYLARCAVNERVLLVLGYRRGPGEPLQTMEASLAARGISARLDLGPLSEQASRRLLAQRFPSLDEQTVANIWAVSAGVPYRIIELGRAARAGSSGEPLLGVTLPPAARRTFKRVALLGMSFTTDEMLAVADADEAEVYEHLEHALAAMVVEPAATGYRFRHPLLRESLVDSVSPQDRAVAHREVADRLAALGASPARVAHFYLAAGQPGLAVPYVLPAVENAASLGAYRDALELVDSVRDHAQGTDLGHLRARRGDLLMALGDPESVRAYREAVPVTGGTENRLVRARLARAACFVGDFDTARAALADLDVAGDEADGPVLLARGNLSYFSGDVDGAWDATTAAGRLFATGDDPWQYVDLLSLQGLIAHQRGQWFERFRQELRRTTRQPGLTTALFDAHLCLAEYLLYGPLPYREVIELAESLRSLAAQAGALRGVAFATALAGEAALLMGDLDRAQAELTEAVDLHRDVDASAGEALSLQRLAEVRLAQGDRAEAQRLLHRALPLAHWSVVSKHLLQRVYGTLIASAPDPGSARIVVDRAEATISAADSCPFCDVMLAVPAASACARVGDLEKAAHYLAVAETSASRWGGTAWEAAVLEVRSHLATARGDVEESVVLMDKAVGLFEIAGQPLDVARTRRARHELDSLSAGVAPR